MVRLAKTAYADAMEQVLDLKVENSWYGKTDTEPAVAELKQKFPGSTVVETFRGARHPDAGGKVVEADASDGGAYSTNNDHGNTRSGDVSSPELKPGHWFGGEYRVFVQHDLSMVPAKAKINLAVLKVHLVRENFGSIAADGSIRAYPILVGWSERQGPGTVCWTHAILDPKDPAKSVAWAKAGCDEPGKDRAVEPAGAFALKKGPQIPGWVTMDVTDTVRRWVAGEMPSHGLLLRVETDGQDAIFPGSIQSSDNADVFFRPKLIVSYQGQ